MSPQDLPPAKQPPEATVIPFPPEKKNSTGRTQSQAQPPCALAWGQDSPAGACSPHKPDSPSLEEALACLRTPSSFRQLLMQCPSKQMEMEKNPQSSLWGHTKHKQILRNDHKIPPNQQKPSGRHRETIFFCTISVFFGSCREDVISWDVHNTRGKALISGFGLRTRLQSKRTSL